jgi:hypothetical protein
VEATPSKSDTHYRGWRRDQRHGTVSPLLPKDERDQLYPLVVKELDGAVDPGVKLLGGEVALTHDELGEFLFDASIDSREDHSCPWPLPEAGANIPWTHMRQV